MVTESEKIHIVLCIDRHAKSLAKMPTDVEIIPSDQDRRSYNTAIGVVHGCWKADTDSNHIARSFTGGSEKRFKLLFDPLKGDRRAAKDIERFGNFRQYRRAKVGKCYPNMLFANVGT
jgi:hypothetical protein